MRSTSIEAYLQIQEEGLLAKTRLAVYQWLYHNGPATARQVEYGMDNIHAHKRLPELRNSGVVQETGKGVCPITGRRAIVWDVTANLPTKEKEDAWEVVICPACSRPHFASVECVCAAESTII
jgi:hypothetical protein